MPGKGVRRQVARRDDQRPNGPQGRTRLRLGFLILAGVLLLDQGSKWIMVARVMNPPKVIEVTSFFNLILGYNRGVSFGLFSGQAAYAPYLLILVGLVIVSALAVWFWRTPSMAKTMGLAAIIGGAVSNIIDRIDDGAVTDFLDLYVWTYHWPAFNLADMAIACGVGVLLVQSLQIRPISGPGLG